MKKLIRIIPSLLIKDGYLVKGSKFENHVYVGDIYNIFSDIIIMHTSIQEEVLKEICILYKSCPYEVVYAELCRQAETV